MELVLANIFQALLGPIGGPHVALFKKFQISWPYIYQSIYHTASDDMSSFPSNYDGEFLQVSPRRVTPKRRLQGTNQSLPNFSGLCRFCKVSFREYFIRMMKAMYILKLYLFQFQFNLTSKEKNSVTESAIFVSLVYVRFWHEDPLGIKAPLDDIRLLELVTNYRNRTVMKTARDTLSRHLWYFSEMLVCVLTSLPHFCR